MRVVIVMLLVLFAVPATAGADPYNGRYSGSFQFDREVDKTIADENSTKRLIRSDHWRVTIGERIDLVSNGPNSSLARYNATITGTVTLQYSESFFGNPPQTASGNWSGSGQVRVEINEKAAQNGVRLSDLSILGDGFSGTMGLPGSWTDDNGKTYNDPFIPMMDAVIAPTEPWARVTTSDSENSWTSFVVVDDDWPSIDTALGLQLVYTPPGEVVPDPDGDKDGVPDARDECPSKPAPGTVNGCPPPNRPPIAVSDSWQVAAGGYIYDNALSNDRDPDGDRFTPRVTSISFRATEWSGIEPDGTFNYIAGAGTRVHQRKVITYHLVDERGASSAPATITIDVIPPGTRRSSSPLRARRGAKRATASATARWYSNPTLMYSCFGSGFDSYCFGVLSPAQVQVVNATTPWITKPSPASAARACARRFSGGGVASCVAGLVSGPLTLAGDKQIIRVAAGGGECLLFRQELNRTLSHPQAGEWTSPEYSSLHSFLGIGKWGTWRKGFRSTWQVPVSCTANAAWKKFPTDLVER